MFIEDIEEKCKDLSKEQLIYIIKQYVQMENIISSLLISQSKAHSRPEDVCAEIQYYLQENDTFLHRELGAYIDMKLGKITGNEYVDIVLGKDD